jgi:hypothetical protein
MLTFCRRFSSFFFFSGYFFLALFEIIIRFSHLDSPLISSYLEDTIDISYQGSLKTMHLEAIEALADLAEDEE